MKKKIKAKLLLCALALSSACQLGNITGVYAETTTAVTSSNPSDLLFEAVCSGDLDKFKRCMEPFEKNPEEELNKLRGYYKNSALHSAILSENFQLVKYILEHYDVDLDLENGDKKTPLDLANELVIRSIVTGIESSDTVRKEFHDRFNPYWLDSFGVTEDSSSLQASEKCSDLPASEGCADRQISRRLMSIGEAVRMQEMIKNVYNIRKLTREASWRELIGDIDVLGEGIKRILPFITPDTVNVVINRRALMFYFIIHPSLLEPELERWAQYIDSDNEEYDSCVGEALKMNRLDIFKKLVRRDKVQENLAEAISCGNLEAVRIMIDEEGADVNGVDRYGINISHIAASTVTGDREPGLVKNGLDIVNLLIERGAEFDKALTKSIGLELFQIAVAEDIPEIVEFLIDRGVDVNTVQKNGNALIVDAIGNGSGRVARVLIARGANINVVGKKGTSLLCTAIAVGDFELAKSLLERGLDATDTCTIPCYHLRYGTLLHLAMATFDCKFLRRFATISKFPFAHPAHYMQELNKDGESIYTRELEERGINLRELHQKYLELVGLLIDHGVNINAKDERGETALDYAERDHKLTQLLLSHGAKRGRELR